MTPTTQVTGRAPVGAYVCMLATALVGAAAVGGGSPLSPVRRIHGWPSPSLRGALWRPWRCSDGSCSSPGTP